MRIEKALGRSIGRHKVVSSEAVRRMYAFDSSPFTREPDLVVFPESTGDVAAVLTLASKAGMPVVARGAGTCLSGGAVPASGGISLVLTRMNAILDIDLLSRTALVQPGVVNQDLQKALAPYGFFFPPDPASRSVATIGGNVAECAGGIQGAKYGVTKNYVLGLELVLSDGTVTATGLLSRDEALGPDSTGIFIGSEGCLAVVTKILVSLIPAAEASRTALAAFPGIDDAAAAVSAIIREGIVPTALELMDQTLVRAVDDYLGIGFPPDAEAVLLLEVDGYAVDLDRQMSVMVDICTEQGANDVRQASTASERETLWKARRSGNGALGRIRPAYVVHDVTVPRDKLAALLTRIRDIGKDHGVIIAQMAHAGDGNAHPHLLYHPDEPGITKRLHQVTEAIFQTALDLGGTISGEHGIGLEKRAYMGLQFSPEDLAFMAGVKRAMDPAGLLNPGKLLPDLEPGKTVPLAISQASGRNTPERCVNGAAAEPLALFPDNLTIRVDARVTLAAVLEAAGGIGATLPLCPFTQGRLSMKHLVETGASGYSAMAYGSLREYIFGLEFTDCSERRVTTGGNTVKNVAGFDATRLFWRAGNAFGTMLGITLKLIPRPEREAFFVRRCPSLESLLEVVERLLETRTCLCTLKAHGRNGRWDLVAGLSGSNAVVESHLEQLGKLLCHAGDGACLLDHAGFGSYLLEEEAKKERYGNPLVLGRGLRSPMISMLRGLEPALATPCEAYVDLDFGSPGLIVFGRQNAALAQRLFKHRYPGPALFRVGRPGGRRESLVFNRLRELQCST